MNYKILDSFTLKWIAIITMVIDHVGAVFFPEQIWLRCIGRVAFPIFCFLLVEGYFHTRNVKKYITRLAMFAIISEIPFDILFFNHNILKGQNVFLTLAIGLYAIAVIDGFHKKPSGDRSADAMKEIAVIAIACVVAALLKTDYSVLGILYIALFYYYRGHTGLIFILMMVLTSFTYGVVIQLFAGLALPIIACYNGQKGRGMKYFFYVFYPGHLLILAGVYFAMYGMLPK